MTHCWTIYHRTTSVGQHIARHVGHHVKYIHKAHPVAWKAVIVCAGAAGIASKLLAASPLLPPHSHDYGIAPVMSPPFFLPSDWHDLPFPPQYFGNSQDRGNSIVFPVAMGVGVPSTTGTYPFVVSSSKPENIPEPSEFFLFGTALFVLGGVYGFSRYVGNAAIERARREIGGMNRQ